MFAPNSILLIFGFLSRKSPLTLVTLCGILSSSIKHPEKHLEPKLVTVSGMVKEISFLHPLIKLEGRTVIPEGNSRDSRAMHSLKQNWPICLTPNGSDIEEIFVQPLKQ